MQRRLVGLALADLDVEAVDAVVADLQRRDAGGGAFAGLEVEQELVGIGREHAQLVELGVEAFGDDAAVHQLQRRLWRDRLLQPIGGPGVLAEPGEQGGEARRVERGQRLAQGREQRKAVAQRGEVARPRRTQGHAREDAFEVADAAQRLAQALEGAGLQEVADRMVALGDHGLRAQRPVQPTPEQAAAHRRDRAVHHAQQGVRGVAVDAGVDLEMPACRRVQRDGLVRGLDRDGGEVGQLLLLRLLDVAEQGARGGRRQRFAFEAEGREVVEVEEAQQGASGAVGVEQPGRAATGALPLGDGGRPAVLVGDQHFGGLEAGQFGGQRVLVGDLVGEEATAREVGPGQAVPDLAAHHRHQQRVAAFLQQGFVGHRARGDDADDLALDEALGQRRVADLLAHRHRFAQRDEAGEVTLVGVHRHAGHGDRLAAGLAALRQRDVEQPRRLAGVVVEQLVEVAHAEEQQQVRMLRLGGEELLHQRGVLRGVAGHSRMRGLTARARAG